MYKLGNLAIICAERGDVSLTISKGVITLDVLGKRIVIDWRDDNEIDKMIYELNHGSFKN